LRRVAGTCLCSYNMEDTPPPRILDPAVLFEFLIGTLCGVVEIVGPRHRLTAAVMGLIWRRVRQLGDRFAKLVERVRAGGFCDELPVRGRVASARPEGTEAVWPRRALGKLRQHFGWIVHLLRETKQSKNSLYWVLARPEFKELIAAAPLHFGRILRPLCRMLGVEMPIPLLLAAREWKAAVVAAAEVVAEPEAVSAEPVEVRVPRPRRVKTYPPAPDFILELPNTVVRPDGSVWLHQGSSTHWKPGCGETLEEARRFDPPVRIWPREE
jgi:hypothetical protein